MRSVSPRGRLSKTAVLTSQLDKVIVLQPVDRCELAADVEVLGGVEEVTDRGVFLVASKDLLGLDRPGVAGSVLNPPTLSFCHTMTRRLAVCGKRSWLTCRACKRPRR